MKNLINQLQEYRLENRISQEKLADMLGVAFVTVNRWFNGHQVPNQIQTYQIEKLLAGKGRKK
jgi:transcriptional regulator with XRE-family HTH domain